MEQRKTAKKGNMEFFFEPIRVKEDQIEINMYSTVYLLTRKNGIWENANTNKCIMTNELIAAVVEAAQKTGYN